jgi:hypothetical protein
MKFNANAIKATLFAVLTTASTVAMAHNYPAPSPTPYHTPTPSGPSGGPSSVPEPSAWLAYAIGIVAIVALTAFNKAKAAKRTN